MQNTGGNEPNMKLVIAEKPSVARAIAKALGVTENNHGYIEGGDYVITWCTGHLVGLADAAVYDEKYHKWNKDDLPIIPEPWMYSLNPGKEKQYKVISRIMNKRKITEIINACDAGREGELIFRFVYNMAGCAKPVYRLWISSMEENAVREGFKNLKPGSDYDNLYKSALCRAKADWLIGINGTRFFSSIYKKRLNIGRVQTPTLAMIAERDNDISSFVRERYYTVGIKFDNTTALSERFGGIKFARDLQTACDNSQAVCISVESEQKVIRAPKLYDLTALQRDANKIFGFTAKQTLDYAQSLYESRLITYPRTDSRYLTSDMAETASAIIHLSVRFPTFSGCGNFYPDVARIIDDNKVSDHHAIIPTVEIENIDLKEIPEGEAKVLMLIICNLLSSVHEPHLYNAVTAVFECGGSKFAASGKNILNLGWKEIEQAFRIYYDKPLPRETNISVKEGDVITVSSELNECYTQPPKSYTEDTLLSSMETAGAADTVADAERKGLGTPATRASIIEKLVDTGLVERKGKNITATADGKTLITILPDILKTPALTADWENKLTEIAKGRYSADEFMSDIEALTSELIRTCPEPDQKNIDLFRGSRVSIGKCPRCGSDVYESKNNFYCENKSCKFVMWKNDRFFTNKNKLLTKDAAEDLLRCGRTKMTGLFSRKTQKNYDAVVVLDDTGDKYVNYKLDFGEKKRHE